jgi:tetratricopeptide (TPR) repeat protein
LLARYPEDVDVLYEAGQMYADLSSQIYLRLIKAAPHSARGYQVIGQVAASEGNWPKAIQAYRQAIQTDPSLPGVHVALAVQLLLHSTVPDTWKEALNHLDAELKINPTSAEAEYEIGEIYRKHGDPAKAMSAFRRALQLDHNFVEARLELAKVLREQDQKQQALTVLEPARESDNPAVHFLLAELYRDLGRSTDAQREQTRFRELQP